VSSVLFVTYVLPDGSTAMPDGWSRTPAAGYLPHEVSKVPAVEDRWIR
jgi:hypothetical protein